MTSIRAELIKKQTETGLTLVWFDRGFNKLNFADRTVINGPEQFPKVNSVGVVSPDGTEVAVDYWTKEESGLLIAKKNSAEYRRYPQITGGGLALPAFDTP